jgi:hypothetical protein
MPVVDLVSLRDCPPGLFRFGDTIGFKTEYRGMETVGPIEVPGDQVRWVVGNHSDAYVVESGESFWAGASSRAAGDDMLVEPIDFDLSRLPEPARKADRLGEWRINPDTPTVIVTPHGRISVNWSVQQSGGEVSYELAEQTAATIVRAVNALVTRSPDGMGEGACDCARSYDPDQLEHQGGCACADALAGAGKPIDHVPDVGKLVEREAIARALFEADPHVGVSWDEWAAYAIAHPVHQQSVEIVRRQADRILAIPDPTHTREGELREDVAFLLARSGHAGECMFGGKRWTGISSNALVSIAFGEPGEAVPSDSSDLAACYRTVMRLPRHRRSDEVFDHLEAGERHVESEYEGSIKRARENTEWPGRVALSARDAA